MNKQLPTIADDVAAAFNNMPIDVAKKLHKIRQMIYEIASSSPDVGEVEECLKWGEPSYLTHHPKSGTSIRLAWKEKTGTYGIYVPCQTRLIEDFKMISGDQIRFDKTRGLLFEETTNFPKDLVASFLKQALTYHLK